MARWCHPLVIALEFRDVAVKLLLSLLMPSCCEHRSVYPGEVSRCDRVRTRRQETRAARSSRQTSEAEHGYHHSSPWPTATDIQPTFTDAAENPSAESVALGADWRRPVAIPEHVRGPSGRGRSWRHGWCVDIDSTYHFQSTDGRADTRISHPGSESASACGAADPGVHGPTHGDTEACPHGDTESLLRHDLPSRLPLWTL
jgi:hypothetical protein